MNENIKRTVTGGLVALVGLVGTSCRRDEVGRSNYHKDIALPVGCQKVLKEGVSHNTNWVSCEDSRGNGTLYHLNKAGDQWLTDKDDNGWYDLQRDAYGYTTFFW